MGFIQKTSSYLKDAYTELVEKVTWPTWDNLRSSSIIVLVASLLIAVVIFAMDFSFEHVANFVYKTLPGMFNI